MQATVETAKRLGYPAALLYGSPDYSPRFGFQDAENWRITTAKGDDFPAFMAME